MGVLVYLFLALGDLCLQDENCVHENCEQLKCSFSGWIFTYEGLRFRVTGSLFSILLQPHIQKRKRVIFSSTTRIFQTRHILHRFSLLSDNQPGTFKCTHTHKMQNFSSYIKLRLTGSQDLMKPLPSMIDLQASLPMPSTF